MCFVPSGHRLSPIGRVCQALVGSRCGRKVDELATGGSGLRAQGRALLEQDLRSPCADEIHEAMQLERDLARADIVPLAWVVNQSLTPLELTDPVPRSRRAHEATHLRELVGHAARVVLEPWSAGHVG